MRELREIITEIQSIIDDYDLRISDAEKLDTAVRIYNSRMIRKFKELTPQINKPTFRQIELLKEYGVENIDKLTRLEASEIIKEKLQKKKNIKNSEY